MKIEDIANMRLPPYYYATRHFVTKTPINSTENNEKK